MDGLDQAQVHLWAAHKALGDLQRDGVRARFQDLDSLIRVFPEFGPETRGHWDRIANGLRGHLSDEIKKLANDSQKVSEVSTLLYVHFQLGLAVSVVGRWEGPQPVPAAGTTPATDIGGSSESDV